jgi:hypothetical protein
MRQRRWIFDGVAAGQYDGHEGNEIMVAKRTQTVTTTTRTTTVKRTPAQKVRLAAQEEQVFRMSKGIAVEAEAPLERKTERPDLLAQLRDIEASLFIQTGRLPNLSAKSRIIDKLKKQS